MVDPCNDLYWTSSTFILCEAYRTVFIHDDSGRPAEFPEPVFYQFGSYRLPDLHAVRSREFDKAVPLWRGVIADTSDPELGPWADPCDLQLQRLGPMDWLMSGHPIPPWFGLALTSEDDEAYTNGIDHPAVWLDTNRILHAAFLSPGATDEGPQS